MGAGLCHCPGCGAAHDEGFRTACCTIEKTDEVMGGRVGAGDPGPHPIGPLLVLRDLWPQARLVACNWPTPARREGQALYLTGLDDWFFKIF